MLHEWPRGRFARGIRALPALAAAFCLASCGDTPIDPSGTAPRVTAIAPTTGSTLGGTTVTISGANFAAGGVVRIGGATATNVVVTSPTLLTAVTAAHGAGSADVVVSVGGQSGTLPGGFTYVLPANALPQITSLTARGSRKNEPDRFADLGEEITVTATVTDAETPVASLTYEWSAAGGVGAFTGTGATVKWRAPATHATPASVPITLVVKEPGTSNEVQRSVTVRVHDSVNEVGTMARDFLVAFSEQDPPDDVMQDFRDGCGAHGTGKQDEMEQVVLNQKRFTITDYTVGPPATTVSFGGISPYRSREADAWAAVPVEWHSTCKIVDGPCAAVGETRVDVGVDWVTAIYHSDTNRWWLCDSDYEPKKTTALTPYLR